MISRKRHPKRLSARKMGRLLLKVAPRDIGNFLKYGVGAPKHSQTLYLDPCKVHLTIVPEKFGREDTGRVVGGDWDLCVRGIDEIRKIKAVHLHILEGKSWEEAGAYKVMGELLEKYGAYDGCKNFEDVLARYRRLDNVIESIRTGSGFLKMSIVNKGGFRESGGVYVHIGRNGEYIFGIGGCHRLGIAQALKIKKIPVQVGVVHELAVRNGHWKEIIKKQDIKPGRQIVGSSQIGMEQEGGGGRTG